MEPGLHRKVAQQLGGGNSSETHVNWSAPRDGATAATSLPSGRMTSRLIAAFCLVKNAMPASFGSHTGFHALPCSDVMPSVQPSLVEAEAIVAEAGTSLQE